MRLAPIVLAAAAVLAGCGDSDETPAVERVVPSVAEGSQNQFPVGLGEAGEAVLEPAEPRNERTRLVLALTETAAVAHLHRGTCAAPGGTVAEIPIEGRAGEALVDLPLESLVDEEEPHFAIELHDETGAVVACAAAAQP